MWDVQQYSNPMVRQDLPVCSLSGFAGLLRKQHAHRVLQVLIFMIFAHTSASPVYGELAYRSDFETGDIRSKSSNPNGWIRQTMDAAYPGGAYSYSDQVLTSDGGVGPRAGKYFLRFEVRDGDNPLEKTFNPRAQLRLHRDAYEIKYDVTHWIGWSTYLPSAEFAPAYSAVLAQLAINKDKVFWNLRYSPDKGAFAHVAWHWAGGTKRTQIESSAGALGYKNPIPAYYDEWIDWRMEIRVSNDSSGKLILWQRRPEQTRSFTKVAEYNGPIGRQSGDGHAFILDVYGGGNFPLVAYHDEVRITNSTIGSADDVDIPTGDSPPKAPVLLQE